MSLPTNDQLAKIDEALEAAGATSPVARGLAVKAFDSGAFLVEGEEATVTSWLAVQAVENAKMFQKPNGKPNGTDDADDKPSKNPFVRQDWNTDKTGRFNSKAFEEHARLVRVNPKMAASLAAAAGVIIGSTRPVK